MHTELRLAYRTRGCTDIHTQEEKPGGMQDSIFTNPLLSGHRLLILRAFSAMFSFQVYVPMWKRSWCKCVWPYKWDLVLQEVFLLQEALNKLPSLSPLPSQPYLSAPPQYGLLKGIHLEVLSTVHPTEITVLTVLKRVALINKKAIHQLLKNSGTEWNCKQDETPGMHEAHTVTVRQLWVSNGETQLKTNTRSKACGSTESLTWGELPGEKPWLETGEVGDWLAGEPALLRYCWSEAYRTTQN